MTTTEYIEHILIPCQLLKAIQDFDGFAAVHMDYYVRHGGREGLCTYREAFDMLTDDLREYFLPVKYSSYQSFKSMQTKKR